MQKHVNLVDRVKSFPTNIFLQNLASIQKRASPIKFAHLAEKSENGSTSNFSTGPASRPGAARAPLTARGVLEENRIAAQNRKDENARVKAEVRAQEVALLEIERGSFDDDIIKDRSKNDAARARMFFLTSILTFGY